MSDGTLFHIGIKSSGGSYRELIIITDTIQSALSIAKSKVTYNETVIRVDSSDTDLYIDYSVCKGKA